MFEESYPNLPAGLSMALMMNERAQAGYDRLSEAEKEHIILKCKDARTKEEMDKIIDSIGIF
ncbi:MAG: hypothetical protein OSJ60_15110 [Lachnospiraceae bacterium]|jgi:hypothetical protein|nr:hypothetical protein [Lachnospiraceae bacterium]